MRKLFYIKLAAQNLKKNSKFYIPYWIASSITTAMFYIMNFLTNNPSAKEQETQIIFLQLGTYIIGIFAVIILLYINSFLMKRRQKEIGLYNVLGMEKRHIGRIFGWETVFSYGITMAFGLGFGILLSKLFLLLLYKLTNVTSAFSFFVDGKGMTDSLLLFAGIFLFLLLLNRVKVHLANPMQLLRGGNVGEKEPKANWVLAVLGLFMTGIGYYIALTTNNPISAIKVFFAAVILVIIGTYFLFIAGTVALLKSLKKNKKFYYQTNHFTAVSGLLYRMKQNAAGLASICVLATMVMVMMSSTISLNIGSNDLLNTQYPQDFILTFQATADVTPFALESEKTVRNLAKEQNLTIKDVKSTPYLDLISDRNGGQFSLNVTQQGRPATANSPDELILITEEHYRNLTGKPLSLHTGEAAVYAYYNNHPLPDQFSIGEVPFRVVSRLTHSPLSILAPNSTTSTHVIVIKDQQTLEQISQSYQTIQKAAREKTRKANPESGFFQAIPISYSLSFNTDGTAAQKLALSKTIHKAIETIGSRQFNSDSESLGSEEHVHYSYSTNCREDAANAFHKIYGGMLFLGLFLSILFLMATVLIIYYKQISEGYDDADRYQIMQKVGMSRAEVKKSIHSQILLVFFLPLMVAVVHMAAVFRFMTLILKAMYLTNIPLFLLCTVCTIAVFAAIYTIVYSITTRTYYKIVSPDKS